MHRILLAALFAVAAGCERDSRGGRETEYRPDHQEQQQEQLATLLDAKLEAALAERLTSIEMSLEQIQLRIELLTEELKSAQLQQDQLATFEAEVKQALVDLGNVIRRAMASQTVGPRDDPRDARGRRP